MEEFRKVRKNLLHMLEDLDEELSDIEQQPDSTDQSSEDDNQKDSSTEQAREEFISEQVDNIQQLISKIDNNTYGICLNCGQPIKKHEFDGPDPQHQCPNCGADNHGKKQ